MQDMAMQYQKRVHHTLLVYMILGVLVGGLTVYMGTRDDLLTVSMSAMGNSSTVLHIVFIVWTLAFCGYFASLVGYILVLTRNTGSRLRKVVYIAVAIMIFGDLMPFVPEEHPIAAFLHDICAQIASISLAVTLMLLALTIMRTYPAIFRKALRWVILFWVVLLIMMGVFGTKAVTEMTGILGGMLYLVCFAWWVGTAEQFDASQALSEHDAKEAEEDAKRLEKKARELYEEYKEAETRARYARFAAEEMRRTEAKFRRTGQA